MAELPQNCNIVRTRYSNSPVSVYYLNKRLNPGTALKFSIKSTKRVFIGLIEMPFDETNLPFCRIHPLMSLRSHAGRIWMLHKGDTSAEFDVRRDTWWYQGENKFSLSYNESTVFQMGYDMAPKGAPSTIKTAWLRCGEKCIDEGGPCFRTWSSNIFAVFIFMSTETPFPQSNFPVQIHPSDPLSLCELAKRKIRSNCSEEDSSSLPIPRHMKHFICLDSDECVIDENGDLTLSIYCHVTL